MKSIPENLIPLTIPKLDSEELVEIESVIKSGYLTQGPYVAQFESMVANFVGSKFAFATTSATTALHLVLAALDIKPGDEVIVPDFTFPATANVVVQQGATPILVDIDLTNYTIDISELHKKLTPKTKCIIPVHAFGSPANMDAIIDIANKNNIFVLEDAACALGSIYKGKYCGALGHAACFSFHPRKTITTGEGGIITTNNDALAKKIELLRNHGSISSGYWRQFETFGYNYRLSDILGAVGTVQMRKLPGIIAERTRLAKKLNASLQQIESLRLPSDPPWGITNYQSFVVELLRDNIQLSTVRALRAAKIEATLGTYALHAQPAFQRAFGYKTGDLPNSLRAFSNSITLPLHTAIEPYIDYISETLHSLLK